MWSKQHFYINSNGSLPIVRDVAKHKGVCSGEVEWLECSSQQHVEKPAALLSG